MPGLKLTASDKLVLTRF